MRTYDRCLTVASQDEYPRVRRRLILYSVIAIALGALLAHCLRDRDPAPVAALAPGMVAAALPAVPDQR